MITAVGPAAVAVIRLATQWVCVATQANSQGAAVMDFVVLGISAIFFAIFFSYITACNKL